MICGVWADAGGCDHFDKETGIVKPEYREEANKIMMTQMLADYGAANEAELQSMIHNESEE
jgi:hypothetical protein